MIDRALERRDATPTTFTELYDFMAMGATPGRWAVDGLWTEDSTEAIAPVIRDLIENMPTTQTTIFVQPWKEVDVPNAAFSMQAPLYISIGCIWEDEQDDERMVSVAGRPGAALRAALPSASSSPRRTSSTARRQFMAPENMERLEQLRQKYDPTGLFHSYLR